MLLPRLGHCDNAAMNLSVQKSILDPVSTSFGHMPRSGTAGSCANSIFNDLGNHHTVSIAAAPFHNLTNNAQGLWFLPILTNTLVIFCCVCVAILNGCEILFFVFN